jgi:hypothetical protein
MRTLVMLLALGLIPVFVFWQKHHYDTELRFDLGSAVERALQGPEFDDVKARLDGLDVTLTGVVADFDLRESAADRVDALPGARVRAIDNRIRVAPLLRFELPDAPGRIEGRLHSDDLEAVRAAVARRPRAQAPAIGVQGHPLVRILSRRQRALVVAGLDEFMVLPGPRSLSLEAGQLSLNGPLTLPILADLWERAGPGEELEELLYRARLYASVYHLPGHRPDTTLDEATLADIRDRLQGAMLPFAPDSATLDSGQTARLQRLADAVRMSAGRARFVIGGHVDAIQEDSIRAGMELGRRRAEVVRDALVGLGLAKDLFEVIEFGPTRLAGEPLGSKGRSVEVLLK